MILLLLMSCSAYAQQKAALVIGNNNYAEYPLKNAVNDAILMEKTLRDLGFSVMLVKDVKKGEFEEALVKFTREYQNFSIRFFYYAGHGIQFDGLNYLVPIGATLDRKEDVRLQGMDLSLITRTLQDSKNDAMNIFVLDACRNNPFKNRSWGNRGAEVEGLALKKEDLYIGSFACFSADNGQKASDGEESNGLYTKILAEEIQKPGIEINILFQKIRSRVHKESNGAQMPVEENRLTGDGFYFKPSEINVPMPKLPEKKSTETDPNSINNITEVKYTNGDKTMFGHFKMTKNKRWIENERFTFNETSRTGRSIILFDPTRGYELTLDFESMKIILKVISTGITGTLYSIIDIRKDPARELTSSESETVLIDNISEVNYTNINKTVIGHFKVIEDKKWIENEKFIFRETTRNGQSIILFDPGRGYEITLDLEAKKVILRTISDNKKVTLYLITGFK